MVLKDHKNKDAIELVVKSHRESIRNAAKEKGYDIDHVSIEDGGNFSVKPVQFVLTDRIDTGVKHEIRSGLDKMQFADVDIKVIDFDSGGKSLLLFFSQICFHYLLTWIVTNSFMNFFNFLIIY